MCVHCGTGRIAGCTSPTRHGAYPESCPPLTAGPGETARVEPELTPHSALRALDRFLATVAVPGQEEAEAAVTRLWDFVLKGK